MNTTQNNKTMTKILSVVTLVVSITTLLLSSCSSKKEEKPLQVDIDTIIKLPDPFLRIKNDYYHQVFEQKGIKYESQSNLDGFIFGARREYDYPINSNSFYIYDFYGVFDGYYCVDFLINGQGAAVWDMIAIYVVKGMEFATPNYFPPVFWKDGTIYQLDEMNDKDVDLSSLEHALSIQKCNSGIYDSRTTDDIFKEPVIQVNYLLLEYLHNCPPYVSVSN